MAYKVQGGRMVPSDDSTRAKGDARRAQQQMVQFIKDAYGAIDQARERAAFMRSEFGLYTGVINTTQIDKLITELRSLTGPISQAQSDASRVVKP